MIRRLFSLAALASLLAACLPEKPDPAAQAAAILHKHPSDFLDQLSALDGMALREVSDSALGPTLIEAAYRSSQRLKPLLAGLNDSQRVELLNAWVFDTLGITPLPGDSNLLSSLPSAVMARKQGSCVGLTLLYLALGKSLDLPLYPVFLPGHIFVRWRAAGEGGYTRNIETLRRGLDRSDAFYDSAFALSKRPWYALGDAEPRQALGALVFNLANLHRARGEWKAALEEFRLAEEAVPGLPEALGSQGAALMVFGDKVEAEKKLRAALAGDSLSEPALRNLAALEKPAP